jgi:hypothetical protein
MSKRKPLSESFPELSKQAFGWNPNSVSSGSGIKREWKCKKGHVWDESPINRTRTRTGNLLGCPFCSGHRVLPGFNDLKTSHPKIAKEAFGWDPRTIGRGSKKKFTWKCSKNHTYENSIGNRTSRNDGCPYCSGRKCLAGFNDLKTTDSKLAKEAFGWDPKTISRGSGRRLQWKCSKGHTWVATPNSRTSMDNGCPGCEITGFDLNKNAWIYLLTHQELKMLQIGITNSPKSRLAKHRQKGWTLLELKGPIKGDLAKKYERSALKFLKSHKALFANKSGVEKFDGWTEAWVAKTYRIKSIKQLMNLVRDNE